jgi:hypothetical protein
MGEISTIHNRPTAATELTITQADRHPSGIIHSPLEDASQLTKLSSVLNGLKRGATAIRAQVMHAMVAVQSGEYHVDPLQVSRSIILDTLARR